MKEIENKKTSKISNAILEEENLSTRISVSNPLWLGWLVPGFPAV